MRTCGCRLVPAAQDTAYQCFNTAHRTYGGRGRRRHATPYVMGKKTHGPWQTRGTLEDPLGGQAGRVGVRLFAVGSVPGTVGSRGQKMKQEDAQAKKAPTMGRERA